ncbi:OmpA family protein [uncultured Xylophilus sp.]|uniref:OmpA family protein n=1 Tax=uncultured Xylophilus sp. TaxID=296832 RepID=UPI0025EA2FC6|nr:OmpA family protein [uncultured Xylophilus sp.]
MTPTDSLRRGSAALSLVLLTACAGNGGSAPAAAPAAPPAPAAAARPPAPAPVAVAPDPAMLDPVVLEFEKTGTALSEPARATLVRLAERAQAARRIVVTGYADRALGANARETAVTRATAVRNELAKAGIPAARMRIKYVTSQPRHAVEVELDDVAPARGR